MAFRFHCSVLLLAIFACNATLSAQAQSVPGELLVKLRRAPVRGALDQVTRTDVAALDQLAESQRAALSAPLAVFARRFQAVDPVVLLRAVPSVNLDSLQTAIAADPGVEWVTRNYLYRAEDVVTPNDSSYADEWWLSRISAPEAWALTRGDTSIIIGIIDTGVDYRHPDLRPNMWRNWAEMNGLPGVDDDNNGFVDDSIGWDFVDSPSLPSSGDHLVRDSDPMDELGHGTFVTGIAAAATDNQSCVASIGFHSRFMILRAGNAEGYLEEKDIAAALLYGAQMGARVINMSFGDVVASPLLRETVQLAYQAGVTLVASAGNNISNGIHYPSGYPEVISVGATDRNDRRASFSNYGPSVTVMAPGLDMLSTYPASGCGVWGSGMGTSYAAPQVAGLAALMLSVNPQLVPNDVKQILRTTADDLRPDGWDSLTVNGRINARRAVEHAVFGSDVVARITSPRTDDGLRSNFPVRGEAWGSGFASWDLYTGLGENPAEWSFVTSGASRLYGDSLGFVTLPPQDTVMTLRLSARAADGAVSSDFAHLFIQRTAPQIDSVHIRRMLDYDTYGDLVQVWCNQMTSASLLLTNASGDSVRQDFGYVSKDHAGVLSQREHPGAWQVRVRVVNTAGLEAFWGPFTFEVSEPPFTSNLFVRTETSLSHGFLGPFSTDFNCNGRPEAWVLPIRNETVSQLDVLEWNGQDFADTAAVYGAYIAQAVGDADQDGLKEVMGRRSTTTRIWEQATPCGPFSETVFQDTTNFTCAAFLDVDSTDGHGEILAWKFTSADSLSRARYILYSVGPGYSLSVEDTLPNLTDGANRLGSTKVVIGDLDHDGMLDFLYGDYDGDIIFCEKDGAHITQKWSKRLPLDDATAWCAAGDIDGDGEKELVAGCRSAVAGGTESQTHALHWEYYIFKRAADDSFAVADSILIQGNAPVTIHPASMTVADVNGDGIDEILISAFPDFYIIHRDPVSGHYVPIWYETPSESSNLLVADWDGDGVKEVFASNGTHIERIQYAGGASTRPHPPLNLTGEPLGPHSIHLTWNRSMDADSYRVYRALTVPQFTRIAVATDTTMMFTAVDSGVTYTYAVASIRVSLPDTFSVLSNYVQVTAHQPATVRDTARYVAPNFVELRFSDPMGQSSMYQWSYHLEDDGRMPAVVSPGEGGRQVYLTFDGGFTPGWHTLRLVGLRDALGGALAGASLPARVEFNVVDSTHAVPGILAHRILGSTPSNAVEITFTDPMSGTAADAAHYHLIYENTPGEARSVLSVESPDADRHRVIVHLDPRYPVGALGLPARLLLRGITNASGVPLDTLAGRADVLLGGAATTLDGAYVFPNPYKGNGAGGEAGVLFAALPQDATIRVFTLHGTLVKKIDHHNASGASRWDLVNDRGDAVASGVYLYSIESGGKTVRGKLAVMR